MMEKKPDISPDLDLAAFFDAAKANDTSPNAAFMENVMALAVGETEARAKPRITPVETTPAFTKLIRSLGGWKSVTASTACTCLGIVAGYVAPDSLGYLDLGGTQTIAETFDDDGYSVASDIETLFQEG